MLNIVYESAISLETFKSYCKFFAVLEGEKIFEFVKKSFEQNYDEITMDEDTLKIKLMINIMDIVTETLSFELKRIKFSNEEEVLVLKEAMKSLDAEKNGLKNEIKILNNIVDQLKKTIEEKEKESQQKEKVLKDKIEDNQTKMEEKERDLQTKIEDNQTKMEEKERDLKTKLEDNQKDLQTKMEEKERDLQTKMEQKERDLQTKMEQKEIELQNMIEKLQKEMTEVKKIEKYVKETIILEEREEKEKKKNCFKRSLKIDSDNFNMEITLLLFEEEIKIKIKEIQDNLENNPLMYENSFKFKQFGGLADYYTNKRGLDSIFEFLVKHFEAIKI